MEIGTVILSKTAGSGQRVELRLADAGLGYPHAGADILIDGQVQGSGSRVYRIPPTKGVRHAIGGEMSQKGKTVVGLTDAEASAVQAALDAADDDMQVAYAQTPAGRVDALRDERERLVDRIASLRDSQEAEFERRHAREDATAWNAKYANEDTIDATRTALAAFDAAHPEIVAALRAERAAEDERNRRAAEWN